MIITKEYYDYEYSILTKLNNIFYIDSIEINSDTAEATRKVEDKNGNLKNITLIKSRRDNYIRLNLKNDFSVCIVRRSIVKYFQNNTSVDEATEAIEKYIKSEWMKLICK